MFVIGHFETYFDVWLCCLDRRMKTFPSMISVVGEKMKAKKVKTKKQTRTLKTKKQVRNVRSRTAEERMKRENIQSLARGPVHPHTNVQETIIQILGQYVFMLQSLPVLSTCRASPRHVGIPGRPIILHPLKLVLRKLCSLG
jgi:hypothetical protein